jgi:metal-responsive CopG/Arc/MetJ family transcriptional regulator
MPTISIRIDEELKKKMEELSHINWSEVIRNKIEEVIEEEMKRKKGGKDYKRILEASVKSYEFFLKYGGKKSEESIRECRDRNWQ